MKDKPPPSPPRRKNDPSGLRQRIVRSASALFQQQGYNGTSIQQVAAAAAVTGGALHHHFATKKQLASAVIAEEVAQALEEAWLTPLATAASARAGVLGIFEAIAAELDAQGSVRGCPVNNLTLELALVDDDFRSQLQALFDRWRSAIAERMKQDGLAEPVAMAATVVAAYSGAMAIAKVEQSSQALRLCAGELERLL